jgi:uncharacterized phiE125 gp8 family phage protein
LSLLRLLEPITVAEARRQILLGSSAGEPCPTAPTVALVAPAAPGNCDNGNWRVGFTHVTADGETELGPLSDLVAVANKTINGQIAVTNVAIGGSGVTARKGYAVPPSGGAAKYFGTIPNNTATTVTLNLAEASLGADAPSVNTTVDPELVRLITAARDRFEGATRRAGITQTWDWILDAFPCGDYLELPKPPLQSVTSVKYYDTGGTLQTWSTDNYVVEAPAGPRASRGRISLKQSCVWPVAIAQRGAVQIRFVCGYGAAASAVPARLRSAMLLDVATQYAQREDVITGTTVAQLPVGIEAVYRHFRSRATQRLEA